MPQHCDVYRGEWMFDQRMEYMGSKPHDDDCTRIGWRSYYEVRGPHTDEECPVPAEMRKTFSEDA